MRYANCPVFGLQFLSQFEQLVCVFATSQLAEGPKFDFKEGLSIEISGWSGQ